MFSSFLNVLEKIAALIGVLSSLLQKTRDAIDLLRSLGILAADPEEGASNTDATNVTDGDVAEEDPSTPEAPEEIAVFPGESTRRAQVTLIRATEYTVTAAADPNSPRILTNAQEKGPSVNFILCDKDGVEQPQTVYHLEARFAAERGFQLIGGVAAALLLRVKVETIIVPVGPGPDFVFLDENGEIAPFLSVPERQHFKR